MALVFEETFEAEAVNEIPTTWVDPWSYTSAGANDIKVIDSPVHEGSRAARIHSGDSDNNAYASIQKNALTTNNVRVDYYARAAQIDVILAGLYITASHSNQAAEFGICVAFWNNSKIKYNNGGNWIETAITYNTTTWYHIRYVIHDAARTYDLYIDNMSTPIATGIAYRFAQSCSYLCVMTETSAQEEAYVDDITITTPVEGTQDFTTYTEVDPNSRITRTASKVTWAGLTRDEVAYVAKNMGADYFNGDFVHQFEIEFSGQSGTPVTIFWAVSRSLGDRADMGVGWYISFAWEHTTGYGLTLKCHRWADGPTDFDTWDAEQPDTRYYITIEHDWDGGVNGTGRTTAYIRTGSHAGALQATLTVDRGVGGQLAMDYIYGCQTQDDEAGDYMSGFTENLNLAPAYESVITEAANATDAQDGTVIFASVITEAATADDEVSVTGIFPSAVAETANAADAEDGLLILTAEITEVVTAADAEDGLLILTAEITEAAIAEDEVSVAGIFPVTVTEAANATDESSAFLGDEAEITEAATADDAEDGLRILTAEITESTAATEATDRSRVQSSTITEAANATEIEDTIIIEYEAEITESATADDEISVTGIFPVTITESANATDAEDAIPSVQDAEITEVAEAADTQESYRVYTDIPPFMEKDLIDPWASGAWLWLVQIAVPTKDTVRIARNTADVRYSGIDYEKFNLQIGEQVFSGDGSIPRVTLRAFQDISRKIETIINETEGALGATVKLIRVNEKFLDVPVNALEADYDLLASESDSEWCTITLGIPNPLTQRFPLEDFSSSGCPWTSPALFKGPKCQYEGDDLTCTGTYEDCYTKHDGNPVHWGGELGLSPSVTKERR